MLQGGMMAPQTHYEEYLAEKQLHDQQQAHNYLKQQIRQTVLTRVGSRGQANQLDEAPETEESAEVIDLTGGKKDMSEESEISKQQRDREQFLQQQRDLMMRHTLQISNESSTAYGGSGGGSGSGSRNNQPSARPLSRALSSPLVHLGKWFDSILFLAHPFVPSPSRNSSNNDNNTAPLFFSFFLSSLSLSLFLFLSFFLSLPGAGRRSSGRKPIHRRSIRSCFVSSTYHRFGLRPVNVEACLRLRRNGSRSSRAWRKVAKRVGTSLGNRVVATLRSNTFTESYPRRDSNVSQRGSCFTLW